MRTIDLAQSLSLCVNDAARQKIALEVGMSPVAVGEVVRRAGALLTAAFATRISEGRENAVILFRVLMSQDINRPVSYDCATQVETAAQLSELECAGFAVVDAIRKEAAALSDHVAAQTGAPADVAYRLTCVCAAILGGLIKHHVLVERGDASCMPGLFANQLATIAADLDEGSIAALGYLHADVTAFLAAISVRLLVVAANV